MSNLDNLCMGCMQDNGGQQVCPHCGFDNTQEQPENCLPRKTCLQNRYLVGKVLDINGEGIGYLGFDREVGAPVYIKEFFPDNLAARIPFGVAVEVITGCENAYRQCRSQFLAYFRAVARMRELTAILPVYDIFEENNTAYVISEWAENITLREFVQRSGGHVEWNVARPLFMPVLNTLSAMQAGGVRHLGISPDSLMILRSGKMMLSGFATDSIRQAGGGLKTELISGYSALEQYMPKEHISEATDVYGFTAALFYALTGTSPQDALKRKNDGRLLIPTSILREIPPHVVTALANGLQVFAAKRTPTFERLRAELSASPTVTMVRREVEAPPQKPPAANAQAKPQKQRTGGLPNFVWGILSCVFFFLVFLVVALLLNGTDGLFGSKEESSAGTASVSSVVTSSKAASSAPAVEKVAVPNLVDQNYEEVRKNADMQKDYQILMQESEYSDTVAEGNIISQSPAYGSESIAKGSVITVVVSKGPKMRALPYIENLTVSGAASIISSDGFEPYKASQEQYSDTVPEGMVIGYADHKAGDMLEAGTRVEIVISKGKNPNSSAASGT